MNDHVTESVPAVPATESSSDCSVISDDETFAQAFAAVNEPSELTEMPEIVIDFIVPGRALEL